MSSVLLMVLVTGGLLYYASSNRPPEHVNASKIISAAKHYAASREARGLPVPSSVSLQELISQRLLDASDVSGFAGMEVTINLSTNESHPQEVLIRARFSNGYEIVTLADGSIQQVPK